MSSVACYLRVSSEDQRHDSQRLEVEKWLSSHGLLSSEVEWYADVESGRTVEREALERLQEDIFHGRVRTVVLWRLDRLSRRMVDGLQILAEWAKRGLRVVVVTQQIDFSGAVGRMLAAVLLGFAEMEWEARRDRQAAGIAAARARGVYRGRVPGSTKSSPERARELRAKGLRNGEVAEALGVSSRTVRRYLQEEPAT